MLSDSGGYFQCTYLMFSDGQGGWSNTNNCPYKISAKCCPNEDTNFILCSNCIGDNHNDEVELEEEKVAALAGKPSPNDINFNDTGVKKVAKKNRAGVSRGKSAGADASAGTKKYSCFHSFTPYYFHSIFISIFVGLNQKLPKETAKWTNELRYIFIEVCTDIKAAGSFCDSGFKAEQWNQVTDGFNAKVPLFILCLFFHC
jgi:hypothetical protein